MSNHRKMVSRRHPFQIAQHHGRQQHFCKGEGGGANTENALHIEKKCPLYLERNIWRKHPPHKETDPTWRKRFPYGFFFAEGGKSIILPPPHTHTLACVHAQNTSTY